MVSTHISRAIAGIGMLICFTCVGDPLQDADEAYQKGEYSRATSIWITLAQQGNSEAQIHLGDAYLLGHGVPQDDRLARFWLIQSTNPVHAVNPDQSNNINNRNYTNNRKNPESKLRTAGSKLTDGTTRQVQTKETNKPVDDHTKPSNSKTLTIDDIYFRWGLYSFIWILIFILWAKKSLRPINPVASGQKWAVIATLMTSTISLSIVSRNGFSLLTGQGAIEFIALTLLYGIVFGGATFLVVWTVQSVHKAAS